MISKSVIWDETIPSFPHLIRIVTSVGDGASKPLDKVIAEVADMWAFAAQWTGLAIKPQ